MAAGAVVAHPADKYANATQPWMRYQPRVDTLTAYKPTMTQRIPDMVKDGLRALGLNKFAANAFGSPIADVLGYSPVGAVAQSWDAGQAAAGQRGMLGKVAGLGGGMALAALGAVPGGKALRGAVNDARRGIVAYHGSPHTFDKFSLDKIGTGEGAQAYGHGLYFAENEDTARAYRNELSPSARLTVGNTVIPTGHKTPSQLSGDVQGLAAEAVNRFKGDVQTAIDWLKGWGSPSHSKAAQLLGRNLKAGRVSYEPDAQGGSMYQVRINADPADFLDWDKPLAEQSDKVRAGIGTIVDRDLNTETGWAKMTGQEALRAAAERDGRVGRGAGEELLHAQGIPGIKYLDAGSRGAGDGSRNFVVFNDKLIDILKRYGWVPGTAIPAGLMANAQLLTGEGIPRETQY